MLSLVSHQALKSITNTSEKITKEIKIWLMILIMKVLNFLFLKKIEQKINICINYPVHISDQKFKDCIDLLMITDKNKSHYVYIKVLTDLCTIRQRKKIKNSFANIVYNVLKN